MHVLARLLSHLRHRTNDRIVLVSNYTQVYGDKCEVISRFSFSITVIPDPGDYLECIKIHTGMK